jgi:hypothetical protein
MSESAALRLAQVAQQGVARVSRSVALQQPVGSAERSAVGPKGYTRHRRRRNRLSPFSTEKLVYAALAFQRSTRFQQLWTNLFITSE